MKVNSDFEPVDNKKHLIKEFDCGRECMNTFLQRFAVKHAKKGLSRTMVLTIDEPCLVKRKIVAYYTLSLSTVHRKSIPASGLPVYPIPVTLLARLAIDRNLQGKKLGSKVLIYALRHTVRLCDAGMPTFGLVIDVLDDEALKFYRSFNFFYEFTENPKKLFVPMSDLRQI